MILKIRKNGTCSHANSIKTVSITLILFMPSLWGMQKLTTELPVQLRNRGYAPLHEAAYRGHEETVKDLIAAGASIRAQGINGYTALHLAAEQGHVKTVEVLVAELIKQSHDPCPRHTLPSVVDICDHSGATALACAALNGHTIVICCLLHHGASMLSKDKGGYYPFHRAAQNGHLEAMKLLQPGDWNASHSFRILAAHCAVKSGEQEVFSHVITHLFHKGSYYWMPEHATVPPFLLAASFGQMPIIHWCLESNDSCICETDSSGRTALHHAARHGHVAIARILLERFIDLTNRTRLGATALHEAAEGGHSDVIQLLVEYGARVDTQDFFGRTPLLIAAEEGYKEALMILFDAGASFTVTGPRGHTALHKAAARGHKDCVEVLLGFKAPIEAKAKDHCTPLHEASTNGHLEVITCLLTYGADINQESDYGNVLIHAIGSNQVAVAYYFIKNPPGRLISDTFWSKALFHAAKVGSREIVSLLLSNVAYVEAQLSRALSCATANPEIERLLIRAGGNPLISNSKGAIPLDKLILGVPDNYHPLTKAYFINRSFHLAGKLIQKDTINSVFLVASWYLDIPVLEKFKDRLIDRLMLWRKGRKNLLMHAFQIHDSDGINWLLDQEIYNIAEVDDNNHDALWYAIHTTKSERNSTRLGFIHKILAAGAIVNEGHLLEAAIDNDTKRINLILMELALTYRYGKQLIHARLSLFK